MARSDRYCISCGEEMHKRRPQAVFCNGKCKKQYYRNRDNSNYMTPWGTSVVTDESDERFYEAWSEDQPPQIPPSEEELQWAATWKRNQGPEPERHRVLREARERAQLELRAKHEAADDELWVEDPLFPHTLGSMAKRAKAARKAHKLAMKGIRPQGKHDPNEAQQVQPLYSRNAPRWTMGQQRYHGRNYW